MGDEKRDRSAGSPKPAHPFSINRLPNELLDQTIGEMGRKSKDIRTASRHFRALIDRARPDIREQALINQVLFSPGWMSPNTHSGTLKPIHATGGDLVRTAYDSLRSKRVLVLDTGDLHRLFKAVVGYDIEMHQSDGNGPLLRLGFNKLFGMMQSLETVIIDNKSEATTRYGKLENMLSEASFKNFPNIRNLIMPHNMRFHFEYHGNMLHIQSLSLTNKRDNIGSHCSIYGYCSIHNQFPTLKTLDLSHVAGLSPEYIWHLGPTRAKALLLGNALVPVSSETMQLDESNNIKKTLDALTLDRWAPKLEELEMALPGLSALMRLGATFHIPSTLTKFTLRAEADSDLQRRVTNTIRAKAPNCAVTFTNSENRWQL